MASNKAKTPYRQCFTTRSFAHSGCDIGGDGKPLPHIPCDNCGLLVRNTTEGRKQHVASDCSDGLLGLKNPDAAPGKHLLRDKRGRVVMFDSEEACFEYGYKHPKSPFTWIVNLGEI